MISPLSLRVGALVHVTTGCFRGRWGRVLSISPVSGTLVVRLLGHECGLAFGPNELSPL